MIFLNYVFFFFLEKARMRMVISDPTRNSFKHFSKKKITTVE